MTPGPSWIARQFWIRSPGDGAIISAPLEPPSDDEVLIRASYSGISRGTEALVFQGRVPPSQYGAMRAPFQEGDFPGPVKYGYANVGRVLDGPADYRDRTVFCLYPHQDLYCVPASAVTVVPGEVPAGRAVLAANMETAVNALWDAGPAVGDRVVVIGGGVVGLLIASLCARLPGTEVTLVDTNPARSAIADALGVAFQSTPPDAAADLVVHASGHPDGLRGALAAAATEATIVEVSWYGTTDVTLPLGEAFHARRLTLRSSQVGRLPPDHATRWTHARRMALALDLLRDPVFDRMITAESDFDALPDVMARLAQAPGDTLCHRIRYPDA